MAREQGWSMWEGDQTHNVRIVKALEDLHFTPPPLLIPLNLLLRNNLQHNIVHNVYHLGGVSM